ELGHAIGAHPAPAVPLGAAIAETDAVHHPRPGEPVVVRSVLARRRVRADAQEAAGELGGNRARHAQLARGDLVTYRREVPGQVAIRRVRHWVSSFGGSYACCGEPDARPAARRA